MIRSHRVASYAHFAPVFGLLAVVTLAACGSNDPGEVSTSRDPGAAGPSPGPAASPSSSSSASPAPAASTPAPPSPAPTTPNPSPPTPPASTFDVKSFLAKYGSLLPHEGKPSGVPTAWDWANTSNRVALNAWAPGQDHINWWAASAVDLTNIRPANTRIELRAGRLLVLPAGSSTWISELDQGGLGGGGFKGDFSGQCPFGGVSIGMGAMTLNPMAGCLDHPWPTTPAFFPLTASPRAVIAMAAVRLVLADPNGPDDRGDSHFIIQAGSDWRSADGNCPTNQYGQLVCGSLSCGRFIYPKNHWRAVVMSTLSAQDMATLPMPPDVLFTLPDGSLPTE